MDVIQFIGARFSHSKLQCTVNAALALAQTMSVGCTFWLLNS